MKLPVLNLLVIHESSASGEAFAEELRRKGQAVRLAVRSNEEDVAQALADGPYDVVLASVACRDVPLTHALAMVHQSRAGAPVIALAERYDDTQALYALKLGAYDYVVARPERLRYAVERAVAMQGAQRNAARLKQRLHECEERFDLLLDNCIDAIAYIHAGTHVRVNDRYRELLGHETREDVADVLLLDVIARRHQAAVKALLQSNEATARPRLLEAALRRADGSEVLVALHFAATYFNGEPCLQLIARIIAAQAVTTADAQPRQPNHTTPAAADAAPTLSIERTLDPRRLRLAYMPIVGLRDAASPKFAVLLRASGEDGRDVPAKEFLAATEAAGHGPVLDRWVVTQALEQVRRQRQAGRKMLLFVKLGLATLKDQGLSGWLQQTWPAADGAPPLVFEIREHEALTLPPRHVQALLRGLRAMGWKTALSHVTWRPETLQLLNTLDVDYLKIDGDLIHDLSENQQKRDRVKAIAEAARRRNTPAIAVHVQDAATLAALWTDGISYAEGYYLQGPEGEPSYDFAHRA